MATKTLVRMVDGSLLTNVAATYYTSPANTVTYITNVSLTNTDTVARTVTLHLVPSAGSATAANRILSAHPIAAGKTFVPPQAIGQTLPIGGTLQALADTGAVVALVASGIQVVG